MIPEWVLAQFNLVGPVNTLGFGKINDTYKVGNNTVVQRINPFVFTNPKNVVENYRNVLSHVRDLVPAIVQTMDGRDSVSDAQGSLWRAFEYYDSRTFKSLPDSLCLIAGKAYGRLLSRLRECEVDLQPSIEGFHLLANYIEKFEQQRTKTLQLPECEYVDQVLEETIDFSVPTQVIHGDCKIGNLLFDPRLPQVLKIVDLDTLMLGCPSWDFGDLVRSLLTGLEVDVTSSSRVRFRVEQLCRGFFQQYRLDDRSSIMRFAAAPAHMSFMLGVRYLTDHLAGDMYFKVERRGANLERARQQFDLHRGLSKIQSELAHSIESADATKSSR